jgi:hypothetical protein
MEPDVECVGCGHMAADHANLPGQENAGGCGVEGCACSVMTTGAGQDVSGDPGQAPNPAAQPADDGTESASAIGYQKTGTTDAPWDGAAAEKALGDSPSKDALHACYAWVDPDGDDTTKAAYKFPHHEVSADGVVGDANTNACSSVIGILNGGRGGADIPDADRQGVYDHVAHHLRDAGKDVPAASFTVKITTLATDVTGGSGAANETDQVAQQLDAIVDALSTGDATADALIQAADNSVDLFLAIRGVKDPDEDITVGDSHDEPKDLAAACQAALKAATTYVGDNDDLNEALKLADQLVSLIGDEKAMVAAGATGDDPSVPPAAETGFVSFDMPIMVIEGVDTGDGRFIDPGILTWRELPQPVMGILKTTYGHDEAELVGRLDSIERVDISGDTNPKTGQPYGAGVTALMGSGVFTGLDNAQQIADLIREGFIRGVSVDLGDVESVIEFVDSSGNVVEDDDSWLDDLLFWAAEGTTLADDTEGDDGEDEQQLRMRERITAARLMGVTICPFPAFEGAFIKLADGSESPRVAPDGVTASSAVRVLDEPWERTCAECEGGLVAATEAPMYPPRAWFEVPEPDELTPMTITDDGRVFGHLAGWQSCHTGFSGKCVLAPRSRTDYSQFHLGGIKTAEGEVIPVGHITMGTGHADIFLGERPALEHYDDTGTVVASVVAVDGKHGIWLSGTLEPDVTEVQVRRLRGATLSGDWRQHGRGLELIAALAVNAPGFQVPRARVASGAPQALVAAGVVRTPADDAPTTVTDPGVAAFMDYVLTKDARNIRDGVRTRHAQAAQVALARGEVLANSLRVRMHKGS